MTNIFVAGHNGLVGSALVRLLSDIEGVILVTASKDELDLTNQQQVKSFLQDMNIDQIYLAAAKVGGIHANNTYPADFIYQNLMIQSNVIHSAHLANIDKLLFLGSSCIYPKNSPQPIKEEYLLSGALEPTNEPYAIAKIAGIKMCESYNRQYGRDYRSVMPTNLYGPNDNYHPENSHVIPGLIRRFHEAKVNDDKEVVVWGSGKPRREFMYVDDMAKACAYIMNIEKEQFEKNITQTSRHINIGVGEDISIKELSYLIKQVVNYKGEIIFDTSKPDGVRKKLMEIDRLKNLNFKPNTFLKIGLEKTYEYFLSDDK